MANPAYRRPEPSPGYKIRDIFMWNLHETLFTPEDFAIAFVQDLDLPNANAAIAAVSHQIRTQLEEYAGVALHPLFHSTSRQIQPTTTNSQIQKALPSALGQSRLGTSRPTSGYGTPARDIATPQVDTPAPDTPQPLQLSNGAQVTAEATPVPVEETDALPKEDAFLNLDDTYRCIITLSIYHSSRLFQDKFEWSLLHPSGAAEIFAKQTCADMGLNGEWVLAITHAIYEAVLKLKKETCEGGNNIGLGGIWGLDHIDNQCIRHEAGAGWRYDEQDFGAEWEPKLEMLSKEEIERREIDRERQLRRQRREMGRFTSLSGMTPSAREQEAQARGSYFEPIGGEDTPLMGRGERNRKKRRLRSPSPSNKPTPEPTDAGWGGDIKAFANDTERLNWRCSHCQVWGTAVWAVRHGPRGPRVSYDMFQRTELTITRHYATTVDCFMNVIRNYQRGTRTCIRIVLNFQCKDDVSTGCITRTLLLSSIFPMMDYVKLVGTVLMAVFISGSIDQFDHSLAHCAAMSGIVNGIPLDLHMCCGNAESKLAALLWYI